MGRPANPAFCCTRVETLDALEGQAAMDVFKNLAPASSERVEMLMLMSHDGTKEVEILRKAVLTLQPMGDPVEAMLDEVDAYDLNYALDALDSHAFHVRMVGPDALQHFFAEHAFWRMDLLHWALPFSHLFIVADAHGYWFFAGCNTQTNRLNPDELHETARFELATDCVDEPEGPLAREPPTEPCLKCDLSYFYTEEQDKALSARFPLFDALHSWAARAADYYFDVYQW